VKQKIIHFTPDVNKHIWAQGTRQHFRSLFKVLSERIMCGLLSAEHLNLTCISPLDIKLPLASNLSVTVVFV
jgi:hypothetical protein